MNQDNLQNGEENETAHMCTFIAKAIEFRVAGRRRSGFGIVDII